ncbi:MAG: hypothetical protein NT141_04495 [candidate division WWE3 bacterium]|nr:hypothetical protein [candidate division WWE3 bacterium]
MAITNTTKNGLQVNDASKLAAENILGALIDLAIDSWLLKSPDQRAHITNTINSSLLLKNDKQKP